MKKIITYIALTMMVCSCNGQEKEKISYPKEKVMNTEKFDIKRFENYPDVVSMEDEKKLPAKKDTLSDGTIIEYSLWDNNEDGNKTYYTKIVTPPPPALFKKVKDFYPSGTIQKETETFVGQVDIEPFYGSFITKDYDKNGYLLKTTDRSDFDKDLKIRFNDLLRILKTEQMITDNFITKNKENIGIGLFHDQENTQLTSEKIIDNLKSEDCNGKILNANSDFERKNIKVSLNKNIWMVTKDMYPQGYWDYKIDGNTGKIIDVNYRQENRP
ncbi:hypothetical protein BA768_19320 [Chryseobacterium sp. CBo1]|nr:hypothetical protein BA768_19320 [Chryseobacterium sp. CBo1]